LIELIADLQDAFSLLDTPPIDLPQIAVVGGQSAGKSSVLESFVGRDFLPRGNGIVTRRPLVLQLVSTPGTDREYGVFFHRPDEEFDSFDDIRDEISAETDRLTGNDRGISDTPINLKIYSPHVLTLTLVDLPGITRVPVGDQPDNIEELIRGMIERYVSQPNCIILAIAPANQDLANSDALQMAKRFDPEQTRTLGVLTKLDLMDRGTDCMKILQNKVIPLKMGYVAVVNRSQQDINQRRALKDAQRAEGKFFRSHPIYRRLGDKCGSKHLSERLNGVLVNHIKSVLPDISRQVDDFVRLKREELAAYGDLVSKDAKRAALLKALTNYSESFRGSLQGAGDDIDDAVAAMELRGGAQIQQIYGEFVRTLDGINILEVVPPSTFRTTVQNCIGIGTGLFTPTQTFELIIRRGVQEMVGPAIQCVEDVHDELMRIVNGVSNADLARFSRLRAKIVVVVKTIVQRNLRGTKDLVNTLLDMEMTQVNTDHPDFVGSRRSLGELIAKVSGQIVGNTGGGDYSDEYSAEEPENEEEEDGGGAGSHGDGEDGDGSRRAPPPPPARRRGKAYGSQGQTVGALEAFARRGSYKIEVIETELLKILLSSYFGVVRKKVQDSVPKAVQLMLIETVRSQMQPELVSTLYDPKRVDELLSDSPETARKREALSECVNMMEKARDSIESVLRMRASSQDY
jgi:replication fork clamp-binding protein CrfC